LFGGESTCYDVGNSVPASLENPVRGVTTIQRAYITLKEAGEYMGLSQTTVRILLKNHSLKAYRPNGGHIRVKLSEVEAYMQKKADRKSD
jgi:excisionase family DNA binding protein